ncbi:MAG: ATP-binding protein [Clostridiaceae bacterium]|nr:ATP-binding protein [Clostridiaceae bacterium]
MKDIAHHLLDIAQNSVSAGANIITIKITVSPKSKSAGKQDLIIEEKVSDTLTCEIIDNGRGMDQEFCKKVLDPFETTRETRDVGLGIPLLKQSCELAGGKLSINSVPYEGTTVKAEFEIDHIDRIPLGDVAGTVKMLIIANPEITWNIKFSSPEKEFGLNTCEIKHYLEDIPLNNYDVLVWIEQKINEGIREVFGGVLDEIS